MTNTQPTNQEILNTLHSLSKTVDSHTVSLEKLFILTTNNSKEIGETNRSIQELTEAVHLFATHVDERFDAIERDLQNFKAEMYTFQAETKDDLSNIKNSIRSLENKMDSLEESIKQVNTRTLEDTNAQNAELFDIEKRLETLEIEFKKMKQEMQQAG